MLRGPRGEKRAADVIGDVKVMQIATAEETEERDRCLSRHPPDGAAKG